MTGFSLIKQLQRQPGFTMVEIIIGVAISGLLGAGIVTGIYQIGNVNSIDNARMMAVKQVENSIHYLNRDVQMAQKVEANGEDYWLKLSWSTWSSNEKYEVIYTLEDGELDRSYSVDNSTAVVSTVGRFITAASATAPNTAATPPEKAWTFLLTASTSHKIKQAIETRQFQIIPRPGS